MTDAMPHAAGTWWPDIDAEHENTAAAWQPVLSTADGGCISLEVWFKTRQECMQWMHEQHLNVANDA